MLSNNHIDYMITDLALYRFYTDTSLCLPDFCVLCPLENNLEIRYTDTYHSENTQCIQLHPHDFFVFQTGSSIKLIPDDVSVCLLIRLNPAFLLNLFSLDRLSSLPVVHLASRFSSGALYSFLKLSHLYITDKKEFEFQIISNLYIVLDSLFPSLSSISISDKNLRHSEKRKTAILTYIDAHIQESFKLNETAQALELTPQYLASWFQKNFDCTFSTYIQQKKLESIKLWLRYTALSDSVLAELFHFKNADALYQVMLELDGISPTQYREQFQQPDSILLPDERNKLPLSPYYDALLSADMHQESTVLAVLKQEDTIFRISPKSSKNMPDSWRYLLNMGYAYQFNDNRMQAQLKDIQQTVHFRYGRICRLLDLTTVHIINHATRYGFEQIFQLLDEMLRLDLTPFIELGYKHAKVHLQFRETQILTMDEEVFSYYDKIIQILPDFLRACCNRYGIETVTSWKFSVYYDFIEEHEHLSTLTFRQYLEYYQKIRFMIKDILPETKVGGADFNIFLSFDFWEDKFRLINNLQVHMDFIGINAYGGVMTDSHVHLATDSDYMPDKIRKAAKLIDHYFPALPVLITEFTFCYTSRNYLNDMVFSSCFLASFLSETMHLVKGMGFFTMSDLSVYYADSGNLFFGGNGLFNYIGLPKPVYHVYSFFRELGTRIIGHTSDYLITTDSNYRFQALFTNYVHINEQAAYSKHNEKLLDTPEQLFESSSTKPLHIQIEQAVPGTYLLKTYTLNAFHGNLLPYWAKCRSLTHLSEQDFQTFKQLAQPAINLHTKTVSEDGILDFSVHLEPSEVKLVLIDYIEN